jgi:hypothetical protein
MYTVIADKCAWKYVPRSNEDDNKTDPQEGVIPFVDYVESENVKEERC